MDENSTMIGVKREEEIELDLGLSIGGGFKRSEKLNMNRTKNEPDGPNASTDLGIESKREIDALRRQEAKRKRQEKQQKKRSYNYGGCDKELECQKSRVEEQGEENGGPGNNNNVEMKNVNLNFTVGQDVNMNNNQNVVGFNSTHCPVMCPNPPVRYVQFANGFQYPCLNVAAGGAGVGNEQSMVQSVVGRSFRPFQESGHNMGNGFVSDQNSRKAGSNGSPMCSSSVVSDYRSSSHEGGGSSNRRSYSSHSLPEQLKLHDSKANETKGQSEHGASSHLWETAEVYDETTNCSSNCGKPKTSSNNAQCCPSTNGTTNSVEQKIPSNAVDCSQTKPKEEAATEQQISCHNPVSSSTSENLSSGVSKESKDMGKPPKPRSQNQNTSPFPHMPCVSTTGNGPNGKTINGFLYRYTKTEVSIICVCHGTSFSPAEFVQHAGSTDALHPLKHITVIPSAI